MIRLGVGLVALLALTSCASGNDHDSTDGDSKPALAASTAPFGGAGQLSGSGKYAVMWIGQVCAFESAPVRITKITPVGAKGSLRVSDFAVTQPGTTPAGFARGRLAKAYGAEISKQVRLPCSDKAEQPTYGAKREELSVELYKPTRASASATSFRVSYVGKHGPGSLDVPVAIRLCEEPQDDPKCDPPGSL